MDPGLIERPTDDMKVVTVERDRIVIPPVHSDYLPGDIGYVELTTFSRVASSEMRTRIEEMKERGMRGFILDLRNNTGGLLAEARNVADIFLPPGKLVVRRSRPAPCRARRPVCWRSPDRWRDRGRRVRQWRRRSSSPSLPGGERSGIQDSYRYRCRRN